MLTGWRAAIPSNTPKTFLVSRASSRRTTAPFAMTPISIPTAASTPTPTTVRRAMLTNSKAKSATPKPATTTSAHAITPAASAAGSAPIGPASPFPSLTPTSPTRKPSTSTPWHSSPSLPFLLTTHYSHLTSCLHFSTHFHSRNKPITPRPTPSILSTSASPIRIRPPRSNEHPVNQEIY